MRRRRELGFLTFVFCCFVLSLSARADSPPFPAGVYAELMIGYDPDTKSVTGYFYSGTGLNSETSGPQFTCIFYIKGKYKEQPIEIETYFPDTSHDKIFGRLTAAGPVLSIMLQEEPHGCATASPYHFADKADRARLRLDKAYPWTSVRVVQARRAYLFASPSAGARRKGYLVRGDGVGVRSRANGWLEIDYSWGSGAAGWISEADLYPGTN